MLYPSLGMILRFPRLQRITFLQWDSNDATTARLCARIRNASIYTPPEHVAGVTEVAVQVSSNTLGPDLPLLLSTRLCNVAWLQVDGFRTKPVALNALAAILAAAPNLEHLSTHVTALLTALQTSTQPLRHT